ncbi:MAG: hypothetical protein M0Q93_00635 [Terrimicrobiaceae bacterium]|nr:hypothetical protein [Terrimicrobiaceae bacterium]
MRTTVTLDPDVEHILKEESHRSRTSFKEVLNAAVRKALCPRPAKAPRILPPRPLGLATGIDPRGLSGLADELEAEAYLKIARRRRGKL